MAIGFLVIAGSYTARIDHPMRGLYNQDLWQIRWERLMMGALPYLAAFFLMIAAPIIYFRRLVIELILSANFGSDAYLLVGIVWIVWAAAWLVVALCTIALAGTVYYRWKVAARHVQQHEDLQRNRDIAQIAYPEQRWGRWARVKRSKNI
ncbi:MULTISPECIES: hypothetical protein [Rhizobium]|uniref:hypothetical protein n=1 Tax=Rhizobium TaxID=379 RepID=UPI0011473F8A|nr:MULTISPECIES: hypothetical protein [Rhizobium]UFS81576.1 hypothetical protein LPB79_25220 [Rhizobium sp. T136]